jgi:NADPH:quinone reductase-like Zn-dependent oxidoreductase
MRIGGFYFPTPLPTIMGLEGTGRVVEANGADIQQWVGKRVSFTQVGYGTWAEYSISTPDKSF